MGFSFADEPTRKSLPRSREYTPVSGSNRAQSGVPLDLACHASQHCVEVSDVRSGIAVPIVVNRLNANDAVRRRQTEIADAESRTAVDIARVRDEAIFRARLAGLNEFSEMLLTYQVYPNQCAISHRREPSHAS